MDNLIRSLENKASTDLSAYEGYCVEFDTSGVNVCNAITDRVVGIITAGGVTNSDVCIQGVCKGILGGTVLQGQHVTPHTDGTIVVIATSCQAFGIALEDGVAGDWIDILVIGTPLTVA